MTVSSSSLHTAQPSPAVMTGHNPAQAVTVKPSTICYIVILAHCYNGYNVGVGLCVIGAL